MESIKISASDLMNTYSSNVKNWSINLNEIFKNNQPDDVNCTWQHSITLAQQPCILSIPQPNLQIWMGSGVQHTNDPNIPWYDSYEKKRCIVQYNVTGLKPRTCTSIVRTWEDMVNELKWQPYGNCVPAPEFSTSMSMLSYVSNCPHQHALQQRPPNLSILFEENHITRCQLCHQHIFCSHQKRLLEYRYQNPKLSWSEIYEHIKQEFTHKDNRCVYCGQTVLPEIRNEIPEFEESLKVPSLLQLRFTGAFVAARYIVNALIKTTSNTNAEDIVNHAASTIANVAMLHHVRMEGYEGFNAKHMYLSFIIVYLLLQHHDTVPLVVTKIFGIKLTRSNNGTILFTLSNAYPIVPGADNLQQVFTITNIVIPLVKRGANYIGLVTATPNADSNLLWGIFNTPNLIFATINSQIHNISDIPVTETVTSHQKITAWKQEDIVSSSTNLRKVPLSPVPKKSYLIPKQLTQEENKGRLSLDRYHSFRAAHQSSNLSFLPVFNTNDATLNWLQICSLKQTVTAIRNQVAQLYVQQKIKEILDSTFIDNFHTPTHNNIVTFLNEFIRYYREIKELIPSKLTELLKTLARNSRDIIQMINERQNLSPNISDDIGISDITSSSESIMDPVISDNDEFEHSDVLLEINVDADL